MEKNPAGNTACGINYKLSGATEILAAQAPEGDDELSSFSSRRP